MNILHLCLSCFYVDGAGYQENLLIKANALAGHNVRVICSTETFDGKGGLRYQNSGSYIGSEGARVIRLPYIKWLPHSIAKKMRFHARLLDNIEKFQPDCILFHGCASGDLATVASFVKNNPGVDLYIDCHEDRNNSARGILSRNVLHRIYYRSSLQKALPFSKKILCISEDAKKFAFSIYKVPLNHIELFPLGGFIESDQERQVRRSDQRRRQGLSDKNFVYLQAGKINVRKKLSLSLKAFKSIPGDHLRFWISGLLSAEIEPEIRKRIASDSRVTFFGWRSTEELNDLLCAADVYLQPGTQSVTMQNALCCGCPVIIDDVPSHQFYVPAGAILVQDFASLHVAMITALEKDREITRAAALRFARTHLDYNMLATRYLRS